jgi:copper(I)-binding protein
MHTPSIIALLFALAAAPASVQAQEAGTLEFADAWIREAPPASPVMAGYVSIANGSPREVLIDAAESKEFGGAEIHEMREINGVMRMRPIPQLRIEPDQTVKLEPGGLHLMLFRPVREFKAGDRIAIEFVFADGRRRSVDFEVRSGAE